MAYLSSDFQHNDIRVAPGCLNNIRLHTKTFTPAVKRVTVHAIEHATGLLAHSWLLILSAQQPDPRRRHQVPCRVNDVTKAKFTFENTERTDMTYEIVTSNPDVAQFLYSEWPFRP